jgi:hypothetical protein
VYFLLDFVDSRCAAALRMQYGSGLDSYSVDSSDQVSFQWPTPAPLPSFLRSLCSRLRLQPWFSRDLCPHVDAYLPVAAFWDVR